MNKFKNIIIKNLTGKTVLILFIITNIFYLLMLTVTIPKTMSFSNEMKLLDMMPMGYNFEYVTALLTTLGEEGRNVYLLNQIPLDMIYPGLFGISYCLILAYFIKRLDRLNSTLFYLCIAPLVAGIADYFENLGIIIMLRNFPDISPDIVTTTCFFSIVKSVSTTVSFLALIVILITLGIRIWSKNKTTSNLR